MNNSIIEFLNLKEEEIASLTCQSTDVGLFVFLSLKVKPHPCPTCGFMTSKIINRYERKINHGLFIDRRCMIYYKQNRYQCPICQTTFNEVCSLATKHQKKSLASHIQMMELLRDPHLTFKKAGELLHLAPSTIMDAFYKAVPIYSPSLPQVLCIDEVYLGRNAAKKYVAVLLDFESNQIVDIIYGRTKDALHSYFQRLPEEQLRKVEFISSDMYEGYRFLQRHYFKQAKLCVDSFHVIQLILSMMNAQLKGLLRHYDRDSLEYYLLKKKRFVLLRNASTIEWYKQEYNRKLGYSVYLMKYRELLFNIHPLIKDIYDLKESYISFNRVKSVQDASHQLDSIIKQFLAHPHKEVKRVGSTLLKWKPEILNSFTWFSGKRISNGPIKSRNNAIKLLIRNAAGYRNFEHLRRRVIYCVNTKKKES